MKTLILLLVGVSSAAWGWEIRHPAEATLAERRDQRADADEPELVERWRHDIFWEALDGNVELQDDDRIYVLENDGSGSTDGDGNSCLDKVVPPGMIGIRLSTGEFVTKWKSIALHRRSNPNFYRVVSEIENNQNTMTAFIDADDLLDLYDLCFWKEASGITPPYGRNNMYRVQNAPEVMKAGRLYQFIWIRDGQGLEQ